MRKRIPDHFLSAMIGGVIGAVVVLFTTGQMPAIMETVYAQAERASVPDVPNGKFKTLEVEELIITRQAKLLNEAGQPELFIRDGSILAERVILANKLVGQQIQGHAVVANRMFATPDNLRNTPMEEWRFFAEIGASTDVGGEVIVRSVDGPASVGRPTREGSVLRMGYSPEQRPQMLAIQHPDRNQVPISFELSEEQKRLLNILGN